MTKHLIILIAFGVICTVFGGFVTFSDKYARKLLPVKKNRTKFPEATKIWTDDAVYEYNRYGLGLGTFIMGVVLLGSLIVKYWHLL
jgi:hypothetical protein